MLITCDGATHVDDPGKATVDFAEEISTARQTRPLGLLCGERFLQRAIAVCDPQSIDDGSDFDKAATKRIVADIVGHTKQLDLIDSPHHARRLRECLR